jgi:hypothetical protein
MVPTFLDSYANYLIVFYLLIGANYIASLFSCQLQYALKNSMVFKHLLGFMTLYFSVVLVAKDSDQAPVNPARKLGEALVLYVLFIMSTRMPIGLFATVASLLFITYYLNGTKAYYAEVKDGHKQQRSNRTVAVIENVQQTLKILAFVLILIGFILYLGQKSREYKSQWDWGLFMLGTPSCKENFLPKKYQRSGWTDFVDGLNMLKSKAS